MTASMLMLGIVVWACPVEQQAKSPEPSPAASQSTQMQPAHVTSCFHFVVNAPMARVAPMFAPEAERAWAGEMWNPVFAWPQAAKDVEGAVFTVSHGDMHSVWVNTVFDVSAGRMQYVAVIPDAMVSVIDVRVAAADKDHTAVEVTYTRTALTPEANVHVLRMADHDSNSGPEWRAQISKALGLAAR